MAAERKASPHGNRDALESDAFGATGVLDPSRALAPVTVKVNERRVARGFWPKIRRTASKIPFAADALSLWYAARDPKTPNSAKGMMLAGLAYFVLPADAIPDILAVVGFTDDAAVIAALVALVGSNVKRRHKDEAQAFLEHLGRAED